MFDGDWFQELHSCYERVATTKQTKKKKKKLKEGDLEDEEPEWVEVTVELLLSLLSNSSHLLRSIVLCVFPHLCPHLTPSAIQQILQVRFVVKAVVHGSFLIPY